MNKILPLISFVLMSFIISAQDIKTFSNPELIPVKMEHVSKAVRDVPEETYIPKGAMIDHDNESLEHHMPHVNPNAFPKGADPALQREYKDANERSITSVSSNIIS